VLLLRRVGAGSEQEGQPEAEQVVANPA
jgi:hypothetical protein